MIRAYWHEIKSDDCVQIWEFPLLTGERFGTIVSEVMHYVARYSIPSYVLIGGSKLVVDFCERGRVRATINGCVIRSAPASRVLREW